MHRAEKTAPADRCLTQKKALRAGTRQERQGVPEIWTEQMETTGRVWNAGI